MITPKRIALSLLALLSLFATTAAAVTLTPGGQLVRCERRITLQSRAFALLVSKKIHSCTQRIVTCKLKNEIDAVDATACLAAATTYCGTIDGAIDTNQAVREARIDLVCGALFPLGDMTPFVGGPGYATIANGCAAASTAQLTDCILNQMRCAAEKEVFRRDPRAVDSLTTAGVETSFPCVGP